MNNPKDLEWKFEKSIEIKAKKKGEIGIYTIFCAECGCTVAQLDERPPELPNGVACKDCSDKLLLQWINEGNVRKGDYPFEDIKQMIWEKYRKELFINEKGYLEIKNGNEYE